MEGLAPQFCDTNAVSVIVGSSLEHIVVFVYSNPTTIDTIVDLTRSKFKSEPDMSPWTYLYLQRDSLLIRFVSTNSGIDYMKTGKTAVLERLTATGELTFVDLKENVRAITASGDFNRVFITQEIRSGSDSTGRGFYFSTLEPKSGCTLSEHYSEKNPIGSPIQLTMNSPLYYLMSTSDSVHVIREINGRVFHALSMDRSWYFSSLFFQAGRVMLSYSLRTDREKLMVVPVPD
jgi:hypothetical protein